MLIVNETLCSKIKIKIVKAEPDNNKFCGLRRKERKIKSSSNVENETKFGFKSQIRRFSQNRIPHFILILIKFFASEC